MAGKAPEMQQRLQQGIGSRQCESHAEELRYARAKRTCLVTLHCVVLKTQCVRVGLCMALLVFTFNNLALVVQNSHYVVNCRAATSKLHKSGLPQKAAEHRDAASAKASDFATQARRTFHTRQRFLLSKGHARCETGMQRACQRLSWAQDQAVQSAPHRRGAY